MDGYDFWSRLRRGLSGLIEMLKQTRKALWKFNNLDPEDLDGQREILKSLLGRYGEDFHFNQPFRCDYGRNISIGERFFANFNLTILDEAPVTIGDDAFIGPNVSIYTACHPIEPRNVGPDRNGPKL